MEKDRIWYVMNSLRGQVLPDNMQQALYLLKKTKDIFSENGENENADSVYSAMLSIAADARIMPCFENSRSFYAAYISLAIDITWEDVLKANIPSRNQELKLPEALIKEMTSKFTSEIVTVMIPEAEKFTACLWEIIEQHENCQFTLTSQNDFYVTLLKECFADNKMVEVVTCNIYQYEFTTRKFDLILASPTFGVRNLNSTVQFMCGELDLAAFENLLLHINPKGRLTIILAARIAFAEGRVKNLREFIQNMYKIEEIAELPNNTFMPYAGIKTYMITVTTGSTDDVVIKKYSGSSEKSLAREGIKELSVTDETFIMNEEITEIGSWSVDRYFSLQSDSWIQYQNSSVPKNKLGDVAEIFRGKSVSKKDENGSIAVINIANIGDYDIDYDGLDHVELEERKVSNYLLKDGDVLIPARGTAIRVAVFKEQSYPCIASSNLIVIRTNPSVLKNICLKLFLDSPIGQQVVMGMQQGTVVVNLSYKDLGNIEVPTPPIKEQEEMEELYIREREKYLSTVSKAEQRWKLMLEELQGKL